VVPVGEHHHHLERRERLRQSQSHLVVELLDGGREDA
jgi:hypothetical protein